eukprot:179131_1
MLRRFIIPLFINFIYPIYGEDSGEQINIVNDNLENETPEEITTISKDAERKGLSHMIEIIIITMLTMNGLFMFYCLIAEITKKKKISKYRVVSSDELQLKTFEDIEIVKNDNNQDNAYDSSSIENSNSQDS